VGGDGSRGWEDEALVTREWERSLLGRDLFAVFILHLFVGCPS